MSISDLNKGELLAIAEVADLWEKIIDTLGRADLNPQDHKVHIHSEATGYVGWIGYNEDGSIVFQPAENDPA